MNSDRGFWTAFSVVGTVAALIISIIALVAATDDGDDTPSPPPGEASTETTVTTRPAEPEAPERSATTVEAALTEFAVELSPAEAPAGPVTLDITNDGEAPHTLVLEGTDLKQDQLEAGESGQLDLGELEAGDYVLFCDVPGHRPAGMEATLTVTES